MLYLHDEISTIYRIKLIGEGFPEEFQAGDILSLGNFAPDGGEFVLLKHKGKYEIQRYYNHTHGEYLNNMLGIVDSLERSAGGRIICLGEDPDIEYVPVPCKGCNRIEVLEMDGKVGPFCWRKEGLNRVPMELRRCICGKRSGYENGKEDGRWI